MKKFKLILVILLSVIYVSKSQNIIFHYRDTLREYMKHVPSKYTGEKKVPLIIALHCAGCTNSWFTDVTEFNKISDTAGFIVTYPSGVELSWNAGSCCKPASTYQIDDIGFVSALIDSFSEKYKIDSNKVFVAGFSNGAIMAYRLAAELSDKISGIASVSGTMAISTFNPSNKIPVIHFHALDDPAVPFNGGDASGYTFPSVNSTLDLWKQNNQCAETPDTLANSQGIRGLKWKGHNDSANVILYTSTSGGHSWDMNYSKLKISKMIWEFFSTGTAHASIETPNTINKANTENDLLKVYSDFSTINIEFINDEKRDILIEVIDINGAKINQNYAKSINSGIYNCRISQKLTPGFYIIRLSSSDIVLSRKLIIK